MTADLPLGDAVTSDLPIGDADVYFSCAVPNCSACSLEAAYRAVRTHQTPFDITLYETSNACHECNQGGRLICCHFCNLVFHATCVPAMRPHVPQAGFVCVGCFADSFPLKRVEYNNMFYQRPPACPLQITVGWPVLRGR